MSNVKAEMEAMLEAFRDEVPSHYSVCSLQAPGMIALHFFGVRNTSITSMPWSIRVWQT